MFRDVPIVGRVQQAAQAAGAPDARGDRAVRHGEARRPLAGGAVRRQGFLRPAGDPARSEMARAAAGRAARLQSRPGPAEFPQAHPARIPDPARHRASHRIPRHLFGRHRQDRRGQHLLLALLAAAARASLSHRAGGGLLVAGAGPPPRGHPRNLLHEPLPRRPAGGDAAEAAQRRGRPRSCCGRWPLRRSRSREIRRGDAVPDHPLRPLRQPGRASAQRHEGDACRHRGEACRAARTR